MLAGDPPDAALPPTDLTAVSQTHGEFRAAADRERLQRDKASGLKAHHIAAAMKGGHGVTDAIRPGEGERIAAFASTALSGRTMLAATSTGAYPGSTTDRRVFAVDLLQWNMQQ